MLEEKVVHLLNQLENLSKQYTPEVFDAAVAVIQMNGITEILGGLIVIVLAVAVGYISLRLYKYAGQKYEEDYMSDWNEVQGVVQWIGPIITITLLVIASCFLFDIWNWIAIFNPKLALAKTVLKF